LEKQFLLLDALLFFTILGPRPTIVTIFFTVEEAARQMNLDQVRLRLRSAAEIDPLFMMLARIGNTSVIILPDIFVSQHRDVIISVAARHKLPVIYPYRFIAQGGGLLSYGIDNSSYIAGPKSYVDQVLRARHAGEPEYDSNRGGAWRRAGSGANVRAATPHYRRK
jgi:hypothetical protein